MFVVLPSGSPLKRERRTPVCTGRHAPHGNFFWHNKNQMSRGTLVSRLSTMRETGGSRDIFKGEKHYGKTKGRPGI